MAAFQKIHAFTTEVGLASHNLNTDVLKLILTDVAPVPTDPQSANLTEIAPGNGYDSGGVTVANTAYGDAGSGVATLTGDDYNLVAAGGSIGPFRYAALVNSSSASPNDLIGFWDRGSSLTIEDGGSVLLDFTDGAQRIITLT